MRLLRTLIKKDEREYAEPASYFWIRASDFGPYGGTDGQAVYTSRGFSTLSLAFPEPVHCQSLTSVMASLASGASAAQDESPASINFNKFAKPSNLQSLSYDI